MLEVSKGNSSVSSSTGDNAVQMLVQKRDGRLVPLHGELISAAMGKAFCAESGLIDVSELELDLQEKILCYDDHLSFLLKPLINPCD